MALDSDEMFIMLETNTDTVHGLSFHIERPWILAGLVSGMVQIWDYRVDRLIDSFNTHKGTVRSVDFHESKHVFVSGGDDCKIKVWDYEIHSCLFTLFGHGDRICTVQFHHELPWILSASHDQTICIWNWKSGTCISVLSGHTHHVTCASFHRSFNLIVSASLDKTVRVWDFGAFRKKKTSPIIVRQELRGHTRGVNWASFHPTSLLIVSGSDDHLVKMWRMSTGDNAFWEVYKERIHPGSLTSVMFQDKQDIIVSTCQGRILDIWGVNYRTISTRTFLTGHDEYLRLAVHPEKSLMAVGHNSGVIVYKHLRKRPAYVLSDDFIFYSVGVTLYEYEFSTNMESPLAILPRRIRTLSYSPEANAILILRTDANGNDGSYCFYSLDRVRRSHSMQMNEDEPLSAIFITKDQFAVLDKRTNQLLIRDLEKKLVSQISLPSSTTDAIFYAGPGKLLCRSKEKVYIFELEQRLIFGELETPLVRDVVWSNDMDSVALLSKHTIIIASKKLIHQCTLHETIRVKSGAWDIDNGVFIYSTLNHIKYCLPNGDSGIIKPLDFPIYITKVIGKRIYYLDRDGNNEFITIVTAEYIFKLALLRENFEQVRSMIGSSHSQLCGQAMITYLQQKGFPELGLQLAVNERIRFNLAIECGNFDAAVASAKKINEKDHWSKLGIEALRQGKVSVSELAYQKTKSIERLSFLYLITGNLEKLSVLMKTAEAENNVMSQFHNALYLGDVKERVKILENAGLLPLAYITASVHGLYHERLASQLGDNLPTLPEGKNPKLLLPPPPVVTCIKDWPLVAKGDVDNKGKEHVEDTEMVGKTVGGREVMRLRPLVAKGDVDNKGKEHVEDTEMVGKTVGGREVMQLRYRGNTWKSPTSTGSV